MKTHTRIEAARGFGRVGMALAALGVLLVATSGAGAAEPKTVTVKADQAKLVAMSGAPNTVVVGNPLYADVSIKQGMIVVHGRHFGTTNVLVLDSGGNELANFELEVVRGGSQNVTVYKAGSRFSYSCTPACESALQVGDNQGYYDSINTEISQKLQLSTGASGLSD